MSFIGRRHLVEKCRRALDAGQHVWLCGERGVGKTTLAKRLDADAIHIPHVTPAKDMLAVLLRECYRRGWYDTNGKDGREAEIERAVRRMDIPTATAAALNALRGREATLILDDFDGATPLVVRIARELSGVATLLVCCTAPRASHKPLLFHFCRIEVTRLSPGESEELARRLLGDYVTLSPDHRGLIRHLVEESQGLPSVSHELVGRAAKKGDLSIRALRDEPINGHRTIDMTPAIIIAACCVVGLRMALRGIGDPDFMALLGALCGLFMILRFFAPKLAGGKRA